MKKFKHKKKHKKDKESFKITKIRMKNDYGPFLKGNDYTVIDNNRDWVKAKSGGKPYYIPLSFVIVNPASRKVEDDYDDFGFDYSEYYDF